MIGSGFVFDAIQSMKNNRRIRKRNLDVLKPIQKSEFIDHTKASPELLASISAKMQKERRTARKNLIIQIIIFFVIFSVLLYVLNYNWKWIEKFFYKV